MSSRAWPLSSGAWLQLRACSPCVPCAYGCFSCDRHRVQIHRSFILFSRFDERSAIAGPHSVRREDLRAYPHRAAFCTASAEDLARRGNPGSPRSSNWKGAPKRLRRDKNPSGEEKLWSGMNDRPGKHKPILTCESGTFRAPTKNSSSQKHSSLCEPSTH